VSIMPFEFKRKPDSLPSPWPLPYALT
jgi:hypothetical protein